jgi:hypothetical protein
MWCDLIRSWEQWPRVVAPYTAHARIVRIVPVWVAEWSAALPHACDSRRRGDLTPVIPGLSGWADARTWVMSQEVSSAPMGEQH